MQTIHYDLQIYPFQIDFMRHVSNIVYIQWMEIGRCRLLEEVRMSIAETDKQGFFPVLVETSISYKKPLTLGDQVHVELWISKLSHASAWMEFQFTNGPGEAVAQGRQRGLFVDSESGRPRRLAVEERLLFERYLASS